MSIEYFKRYFGYTFWVGLEAVVFAGVSRLLIFPIAAYLLGKEEFGLFLFSLGIVMMIGKAPSGGLETGIIRHFAELDGPGRDILVSTGLKLCKIAMWLVVFAGIVVLGVVRYFRPMNPKIILCLIPLFVLLYSWNLFELQMVRYRVERKFALRTGWYGILGASLFISIPAAIFFGVIGMAWGFTLGYMIAQIMLSWRQGILFKRSVYDAKMASSLMQIWFHLTVAGVIMMSSKYIYSIILGIFNSYSSVSVFFGATNIIYLAIAPLTILSSLLLSMLAGFKSLANLGKRQRYTVLAGAVSIAVGASLVVFIFGPFILSVMFPEFAAESSVILRWLVFIIPWRVAEQFSRPFVAKFGPIKFVPVLNFIALLGHLIPAALLIPKLGINGAVISYNIGCGMSAIAWLGTLIWTFKFCSVSEPYVESNDFVEDHASQK